MCCLDRGRGRAFKVRRAVQGLNVSVSESIRWHGDSQADSGRPAKVLEEAQSFEDMEQDFEATRSPGPQEGFRDNVSWSKWEL